MTDVHVYPLDDMGKIVSRNDISAGVDDAALQMARKQFPGLAVEIWCGTRAVEHFDRDDQSHSVC